MLLPSALGFSPHPPVSVYGTGSYYTIAAFLDGLSSDFTTLGSLHITPSRYMGDLPPNVWMLVPGLLSRLQI